ncbi:hypothetical protein [Embleya sp. NPDC005575]|uniref:hypothetical protein n=1 Tax=Embleya sp. NPDC005575 TaxID=3156892 RepID=UPI0033BF945A
MTTTPQGSSRCFPPHAVHSVRATYVRQAGCPAYFADVTFDVEPAHASGSYVEVAVPHGLRVEPRGEPLVAVSYLAAFRDGFADALAEHRSDVRADVLIVVRKVTIHEVDSNDSAFRHAGRLALDAVIRRLAEDLAPDHPAA